MQKLLSATICIRRPGCRKLVRRAERELVLAYERPFQRDTGVTCALLRDDALILLERNPSPGPTSYSRILLSSRIRERAFNSPRLGCSEAKLIPKLFPAVPMTKNPSSFEDGSSALRNLENFRMPFFYYQVSFRPFISKKIAIGCYNFVGIFAYVLFYRRTC